MDEELKEPGPGAGTPAQTEGEVNLSARRRKWQADNVDAEARALLDRDARAFLHQSVSTPCLTVAAKAEGISIDVSYDATLSSPAFLGVPRGSRNRDAAMRLIDPTWQAAHGTTIRGREQVA